MPKQKHRRHAPAFILLTIAKEPTHGLGILNKMESSVPENRLDTAIVYRTLKDLEKDGYVSSTWEDSGSGPKRKVYSITDSGIECLAEYKKDIERSILNLERFLELYDEL